MTTVTAARMTAEEWRTANSRYLAAEMQRLRLLLNRRILWLRKHWRREAAQNYLSWAISDQEADILLAGSDHQEELGFYESDPAAQSIAGSLVEVSRQLSAQREEMQAAGTSSPLDTLAARFELTPFERDVVLLCLAPELDPAFERLYEIGRAHV